MKEWVIIGLAALLIVFIPLAFIWSLNTLFHLGIEYTIWTWFAALILAGSVTSRSGGKS